MIGIGDQEAGGRNGTAQEEITAADRALGLAHAVIPSWVGLCLTVHTSEATSR